ncbi:MAG: hypothetical protein E7241_10930 [Lachnospiraceae bacterium]|nr:hypothetical protein [Lachnospiraceae bacterium]
MGFFDFFKKNKKDTDYTEEIDRVFEEYEPTGPAGFDRPETRQHYIFDKCEEMIECSKRIDEARVAYDTVTAYLLDVDLIDNMPVNQRNEIDVLAERIYELQVDRKEYQDFAGRLEDVRFSGIRLYEDDFPECVDRLKENEKYKAMVRRDIDALQGEKSAIRISVEEAQDSNKRLKKWAFILPFVFAILVVGAFFLKLKLYWDITTILCAIIFVICAAGCAVILKNQRNNYNIKQGIINLNHAIVLLNRMKAKYVNVTNAVEYAYDKYNVNSSYELDKLWMEYSDLKRERAKHNLSTTELDHYSNMLVHELARYDINDPTIWPNQVLALINPKEMVEIRHNLNGRRQKLRSRIDYNLAEAEKIKADVLRVVADYPQYSDEILEIVKSIDINLGI